MHFHSLLLDCCQPHSHNTNMIVRHGISNVQMDFYSHSSGPTPYNVPVEDFVNGFLSLRVSAQDAVGNSDTEELTFSSSSCERK